MLFVAGIFSWLNPLNDIANAIGSAVTWAITHVGQAMASSSQVTFGQRYTALYGIALSLAIVVGAGALLYGAAAAALSGDLSRIVRALTRVGVGIVGSFALLTLVLLAQHAIYIVDTKFIAPTFLSANKQVAGGIGLALAGAVGVSALTGAGSIIAIVLGLVVVIGALALWAVLLLSTAILYVACYFAPIAFVISAKAGKKMLELIVAMLLTPFVITSIMAIGLAILGDGKSPGVVLTHFLMGAGLIYVACFAPLAIMRFLPIAEEHISSLRHPHQAAQQAGSNISNISSRIRGGRGGSSPADTKSSPAGNSGGAAAAGAAIAAASAAKNATNRATTGNINQHADNLSATKASSGNPPMDQPTRTGGAGTSAGSQSAHTTATPPRTGNTSPQRQSKPKPRSQ